MYDKLRKTLRGEEIPYTYLAKLMGFSPQYIAARMHGTKCWTVDEAYFLCDLLHIQREDFFEYFPRGGKLNGQ
nr:MAG TPA: Regulatory protein [Caudoviricetes sp.]